MNKKMSWIVGWTALAAFVIVLPHLLPNTYFIRILNMVGIYILLATGSNILTGYAGQLSMGQAAFYGVGAYTVGLMSMYLKADFLVILPVAILVACVFGIVLAVPALRLKGGYLTLLTIGFAEIFRLVMNNWVSFTKGPSGITSIPTISVLGLTLSSKLSWYYFIYAVAALGLAYQATREGIRADIAGHMRIKDAGNSRIYRANHKGHDLVAGNVDARQLCSLVILADGNKRAAHAAAHQDNESNFILWAAIIGGLGTQMGPILGGFIMIVFPEALRALGTWRLIIFGVILMLVIIYYPQGLVPFLQEMKKKIAAKFEKRTGKEGK